jgi:hypothetical protein
MGISHWETTIDGYVYNFQTARLKNKHSKNNLHTLYNNYIKIINFERSKNLRL